MYGSKQNGTEKSIYYYYYFPSYIVLHFQAHTLEKAWTTLCTWYWGKGRFCILSLLLPRNRVWDWCYMGCATCMLCNLSRLLGNWSRSLFDCATSDCKIKNLNYSLQDEIWIIKLPSRRLGLHSTGTHSQRSTNVRSPKISLFSLLLSVLFVSLSLSLWNSTKISIFD